MPMTPAGGNQELPVSMQDGYLDMSPSSKSFPKNYNGNFIVIIISCFCIILHLIHIKVCVDSENLITDIITIMKVFGAFLSITLNNIINPIISCTYVYCNPK